MRKIIYIFLALHLLTFVLPTLLSTVAEVRAQGPTGTDPDDVSGPNSQPLNAPGAQNSSTKTPCEQWSSDPVNQNSTKVCTDLIEGIPMLALGNGTECVPGAERNGVCYAVISPTGLGAIEAYVAVIYRYAGWTIGILGVLIIIFSGIQFSLGGASPDKVNEAKKRIFQVIGGIVVFFLIGVILRTINPNFFT